MSEQSTEVLKLILLTYGATSACLRAAEMAVFAIRRDTDQRQWVSVEIMLDVAAIVVLAFWVLSALGALVS